MINIKKKQKIIFIFLVLVLGMFISLFRGNVKLQVTYYEVENIKIPASFDDFKIIQLSDFHNPSSKELINDIIDEIKEETPDIITITGDFIDAHKPNIDIAIDFIKEIKSVAPIYYILGNHEVSYKEYPFLESQLEENGVIILDNKVEVIKLDGDCINLMGINDPHLAHEQYVDDEIAVEQEIKELNFNSENYSILLSHRPELFTEYVSNNIDLVLTGHAHGGQIRIPLLGGIYAPHQGFLPKYTSGIFKEDRKSVV